MLTWRISVVIGGVGGRKEISSRLLGWFERLCNKFSSIYFYIPLAFVPIIDFFYVFDLHNPAELTVVFLLVGCSYTISCLHCKHATCVYRSEKNNWSGLRDLCCGKCLLVHTRHHTAIHNHRLIDVHESFMAYSSSLSISLTSLTSLDHMPQLMTMNDGDWFSFSLSLSLALSLHFCVFLRGVILLKCYQWCVAIHYSFSRQSTLPCQSQLASSFQSLSTLGIILVFDNDYESFAMVWCVIWNDVRT